MEYFILLFYQIDYLFFKKKKKKTSHFLFFPFFFSLCHCHVTHHNYIEISNIFALTETLLPKFQKVLKNITLKTFLF